MSSPLERWRERSFAAECEAYADGRNAEAAGHMAARTEVHFIVDNTTSAERALKCAVDREQVMLDVLRLALQWLREEVSRG